MDKFFNPQSVAVVGASATPGRGGYSLVVNLKAAFPERLYPINPKYKELEGLTCYPSVSDLPEPADLTIIFVPAAIVPSVLEECGRNNMTRIMIQSAGFSEAGKEGRRLQQECDRVAAEYGLRLWGPNCMGVVRGKTQMVASFMTPSIWPGNLKPGGVSLIVQSGMLAAGFLIQVMSDGYFGLASACSIGNKSDVNECDLLEYLAGDPETEVVGLYLESLVDPPRFRKAIERLNKPVVILKGGLTEAGAKAAQSHTASLAGNAQVAEGFFRQLGLLQARDFVEQMDLLKALYLWRKKSAGHRMAVLTFSGAGGIVNSDHLIRAGMELAELSPQTLERLKEIYPPWMPPANPLDIWPAVERSGPERVFQVCFEALMEDPNVDGVHAHLFAGRMMEADLKFLEPCRNADKPVAVWPVGDSSMFRQMRETIESYGVPVFYEIGRGVRAFQALAEIRGALKQR
jgi:acyl-CoA synthetase (NDP forming)